MTIDMTNVYIFSYLYLLCLPNNHFSLVNRDSCTEYVNRMFVSILLDFSGSSSLLLRVIAKFLKHRGILRFVSGYVSLVFA